MVDIQSPTAEIRRGKKERRNRMKIYMVSLLHRATIIRKSFNGRRRWPLHVRCCSKKKVHVRYLIS